MPTRLLLGYDIGGTRCAVVLGEAMDGTVAIRHRAAFSTDHEGGPDAVLASLEAAARELIARHGVGMRHVEAVGISCGGPLDSRAGVILGPPNLPGWDHVPIVGMVQCALGRPVYLQNDANAGALAEWQWGAGQGMRNLVFLTFGTGLGAGLILDGRLYTGRSDLAGEVGHVRLAEDGPVGYHKAGSFEGFCSGAGLLRLATRRLESAWASGLAPPLCPSAADLARLSVARLAEAARAGDDLAREVFATSGAYLGRGLAVLMDVLNPDAVIIGSIFLRCKDLLEPHMRSALEREVLPGARCPVQPAGLGEAVGDHAALAVALYGDARAPRP